VAHGTEFHPSPKRTRTRRRARRGTQARATQPALGTVPEVSADGDESNEEEVVVSLLGGESKGDMFGRGGRVTHATFGVELTNSPTRKGAGGDVYGNGWEEARMSPSKLGRGQSRKDLRPCA
jgi:hypothetical protein